MSQPSAYLQQLYNSNTGAQTSVGLEVEDAATTDYITTNVQANVILDSMAIVAADVAKSAASVTASAANVTLTNNNVITTNANVVTSTQQVELANVARAASEAARDAATLSAGVYDNISLGLAATMVGRYFTVPSEDNREYLILYRHQEDNTAREIQRYPSINGLEYSVDNVIHIKSNGNDNLDGGSWNSAVRTIEKALELATLRGTPTLIEWAPESVVYTKGHLDMPDNCVIKATHRTVFLRPEPGYEERNVFRMGSGCFLEGVMFEGWRLDSLTDPTEGFAVSFRPGAVITRVPYAHKIAVRSIPTWSRIPPPLDVENGNPLVPRGGGVALADGLVCSQYSIFPNIMTWGATPVVPNGIGYCAKNGGLINAVNAVSIWAHKHFMAVSGGQIILSACSTQFGDYTLVASGGRNIVVPTKAAGSISIQTTDADTITQNAPALVNSMWTALSVNGYNTTWTAVQEANTRADASLLLQCLIWVLQTGNEQPMLDFAKGLFNPLGKPAYVIPTKSAVPLSTQTAAAAAIKAAEQTIINTMWDQLVGNNLTIGWTPLDETYTRRDALNLLQTIQKTLLTATEQPMINFALGLFNASGGKVFSEAKLPGFIFAFNNMKNSMIALPGVNNTADELISSIIDALINTLTVPSKVPAFIFSFQYLRDTINQLTLSATTKTMVTNLFNALITTFTNPATVKDPSRITAIGHTWTAVMGGVALTKIPPANNNTTILDSIIEESDGVVIASGQDDQGNALFVGGLQISADTGELGGPPFDQAVRRVATRSAISRSF
jgi:hypothetical protein